MDVDTIAAVATAPGTGAVAVVRVSGPAALRVLREVAPELRGDPPARRAVLADVRDPASGASVDRALVTFFPGPRSYTGEDVVEISGHGGWMAPALVLEACLAAGARPAEAGEFTRRAYLHGRMDLVQAEAVADLVEGRSRALHDAALRQLDRGLSSRLATLRERLVEMEALLVHHLDFPEEDEAPASTARVISEARALAGELKRLLATAPEGELLREGALTVLAGRPNTGKSSLFNALLGEARAIVTEVPGTTRDALEAGVSLGGFPFRLVDTAGLRQASEPVERLGIEVAERYLRAADLVLLCAEAGRALGRDEEEFIEGLRGRPAVILRTKADAAGGGDGGEGPGDGGRRAGGAIPVADAPAESPGGSAAEPPAPGPGGSGTVPRVRVSALTGEGMDRLRTLLPSLVYRGLVASRGEVPVLLRERQARGVRAALEEVEAFADALERGVPAEAGSAHLRSAETALEATLGVVSPEEILDRVFSRFCIGK